MSDLNVSIYQKWIEAKKAETEAQNLRRELEDQITKELGFPEDFDKSTTMEIGDFKIKATGRINRRVDSDYLQEVAAENGLSDFLPTLFRWKADIDTKKWKDADEKITSILSKAITAKPGRISYSIEKVLE